MAQTKIASFAKWLAGSLFLAVSAYLGQLYATIGADEAQNRPRQIDIQKVPQLSWGTLSPVPNARFILQNTQTNAKIDQVADTEIVLYNYTDRDAAETQITIAANNADGSLPEFLGARAMDGGIEDFSVAESIKPVVHGRTVAFSFKVPQVLRSTNGNGSHSFQLYFVGKVAPNLAVSASAPNFGWRAWDSSHLFEMQLAERTFFQRYGARLAMIATIAVALMALIAQGIFLRNREKKRMMALTDVVDETLKNAKLKDLSNDQRRLLASDVALNSWTSIYKSMGRLEQQVSSKPERVA
ncbi:hypothetical protein M3I54_37655 [Paraburkholderia sp. CNPSo 3274]|uniref:hypothetical protein n=1 Tax=unclassified Paraburkholderia TaxID=2615204 RepID=UPI0020B6DCFD|nr:MULTISPECIES: hypothetical protein [unclassified Paraburkholderia]MCP3712580.1 hypothetical protein [Paraburkholderia sp. CNPSo 3274]MCP3718535.1 hypothetical protein [Paraburkholderia sp. CNPSo 3281]MCP3724701.1 hypothetical protein [Paraburkholderia sp. CNPSo 3272]